MKILYALLCLTCLVAPAAGQGLPEKNVERLMQTWGLEQDLVEAFASELLLMENLNSIRAGTTENPPLGLRIEIDTNGLILNTLFAIFDLKKELRRDPRRLSAAQFEENNDWVADLMNEVSSQIHLVNGQVALAEDFVNGIDECGENSRVCDMLSTISFLQKRLVLESAEVHKLGEQWLNKLTSVPL